MADIGGDWSVTYARACENWACATIVREKRGRPPKRAKASRWRSQQQRAFAAGVLHSVGIYEGLKPHEREIRAMLCARGLLDNDEASQNRFANAVGVRPNPNDASSASDAAAWLDANCFVTGHEKDHRTANSRPRHAW